MATSLGFAKLFPEQCFGVGFCICGQTERCRQLRNFDPEKELRPRIRSLRVRSESTSEILRGAAKSVAGDCCLYRPMFIAKSMETLSTLQEGIAEEIDPLPAFPDAPSAGAQQSSSTCAAGPPSTTKPANIRKSGVPAPDDRSNQENVNTLQRNVEKQPIKDLRSVVQNGRAIGQKSWNLLCQPRAEDQSRKADDQSPLTSPTENSLSKTMDSVSSSMQIEPGAKRSVEDVLHLNLGMIENHHVPEWPTTAAFGIVPPVTSGSQANMSPTAMDMGVPPIPVWPPTLQVSCQGLRGEMYLDKLYAASDGKLDPRVQSILCQGIWMTPREFEVQSGRGKHKNWKYSVRFNGRPVREVLSDIEKAFALGYSRHIVFSGSEPPMVSPMVPWTGGTPQRPPFADYRMTGTSPQHTRSISDAGTIVHMATPVVTPDGNTLNPFIRPPLNLAAASMMRKTMGTAVGIEHQLVDSLLAAMRDTMEDSVRAVVRQELADEESERQRLRTENENLRQRLSQLDRDLQTQRNRVTNVKSLLTSMAAEL